MNRTFEQLLIEIKPPRAAPLWMTYPPAAPAASGCADARRRTALGTWRRLDFRWPDHGVCGEADGLVKCDPETGRAVLLGEKRRDRALLGVGLETVRWDGREMYATPLVVVRRVALTLQYARPPRRPIQWW